MSWEISLLHLLFNEAPKRADGGSGPGSFGSPTFNWALGLFRQRGAEESAAERELITASKPLVSLKAPSQCGCPVCLRLLGKHHWTPAPSQDLWLWSPKYLAPVGCRRCVPKPAALCQPPSGPLLHRYQWGPKLGESTKVAFPERINTSSLQRSRPS
ncbi:hypothetical protein AOLI_G00119100 [Acnodon oligacanthus]